MWRRLRKSHLRKPARSVCTTRWSCELLQQFVPLKGCCAVVSGWGEVLVTGMEENVGLCIFIINSMSGHNVTAGLVNASCSCWKGSNFYLVHSCFDILCTSLSVMNVSMTDFALCLCHWQHYVRLKFRCWQLSSLFYYSYNRGALPCTVNWNWAFITGSSRNILGCTQRWSRQCGGPWRCCSLEQRLDCIIEFNYRVNWGGVREEPGCNMYSTSGPAVLYIS